MAKKKRAKAKKASLDTALKGLKLTIAQKRKIKAAASKECMLKSKPKKKSAKKKASKRRRK